MINVTSNGQEVHIGESMLKSSDCEKLRGMKTDSKIHF